MYRLIYTSTAKAHITKANVEDILLNSRVKNHSVLITGILLFGGGHFLQYLEGGEDTVTRTFDRIAADDRHYEVTILTKGAIEFREFSRWDMANKIVPSDILDDTIKAIVRDDFRNVAATLSAIAEVG
ncbi:MAG: BLUF domain-containing protein [Sphingomonadaceae bacterium]|nr:BLUF domain-containing protein [Sphingomonadaceae bacterium]